MFRQQLIRGLLCVMALMMVAACAKTPANPFRNSSAYSALPYTDQEKINVLAFGELHYAK